MPGTLLFPGKLAKKKMQHKCSTELSEREGCIQQVINIANKQKKSFMF